MQSLLEQYQCESCVLRSNGVSRLVQTPGGGLRKALEEMGLQPLCDFLNSQEDPCASVLLQDGEDSLKLERAFDGFVLLMTYADGTSYSQRFSHLSAQERKVQEPMGEIPAAKELSQTKAKLDFRNISPQFCEIHHVNAPYIAGAMAGGISSVKMVQAMSQAGYLAFLVQGAWNWLR